MITCLLLKKYIFLVKFENIKIDIPLFHIRYHLDI